MLTCASACGPQPSVTALLREGRKEEAFCAARTESDLAQLVTSLIERRSARVSWVELPEADLVRASRTQGLRLVGVDVEYSPGTETEFQALSLEVRAGVQAPVLANLKWASWAVLGELTGETIPGEQRVTHRTESLDADAAYLALLTLGASAVAKPITKTTTSQEIRPPTPDEIASAAPRATALVATMRSRSGGTWFVVPRGRALLLRTNVMLSVPCGRLDFQQDLALPEAGTGSADAPKAWRSATWKNDRLGTTAVAAPAPGP